MMLMEIGRRLGRGITLACVCAVLAVAPIVAQRQTPPVPGGPGRSGATPPPPERASGTMPRYPDDARQRGIGGVVTLTFMVDPGGEVRDVKVIRSIPMLEASAAAAVKTWHYKPLAAVLTGKPAPVEVTVFFLFDAAAGRVSEARRISPQGPQPRRTKQVTALYPASVTGNRPGRVVLDVVVNAAGKVIDIRVQSATSGFEAAARDAVRQWEYEPLVVNGTPVPFVATVTVLFSKGSHLDPFPFTAASVASTESARKTPCSGDRAP